MKIYFLKSLVSFECCVAFTDSTLTGSSKNVLHTFYSCEGKTHDYVLQLSHCSELMRSTMFRWFLSQGLCVEEGCIRNSWVLCCKYCKYLIWSVANIAVIDQLNQGWTDWVKLICGPMVTCWTSAHLCSINGLFWKHWKSVFWFLFLFFLKHLRTDVQTHHRHWYKYISNLTD